ncbi:transglutaminase family protein [Alkalinema sp. FACHB-956]|uniref:transglutaminase domain-containing protein n=1 Tax=Alkalinema sp. FACHB-956 TaxID=2692768 RepID=UPI001688BA40|nr:transglutaminase family protein [Alkalinema sp. FACHB-956]MBD2330043.1 transglutaminase family protein [Alkalinema sp. FACHB-956]
MRFDFGCRMQFSSSVDVPVILMLRPRSGYRQWIVQETYALEPFTLVTEYTDGYGNLCQRLIVPAGEFQLQVTGQAETLGLWELDQTAPWIAIEALPDSILQFVLPSRYCESDQVYDWASEITANLEPGYAQAEAIRQWIHDNIQYQYGTSDASTSALNVIQSRQGVCRDFAHLGIALCRSLNIPARMVVGYLHGLKPMDQHAWFEAYLGHRWCTFDATQTEHSEDRIVIAYGRDAADVALVTQFGPLQLNEMQVWIEAM